MVSKGYAIGGTVVGILGLVLLTGLVPLSVATVGGCPTSGAYGLCGSLTSHVSGSTIYGWVNGTYRSPSTDAKYGAIPDAYILSLWMNVSASQDFVGGCNFVVPQCQINAVISWTGGANGSFSAHYSQTLGVAGTYYLQATAVYTEGCGLGFTWYGIARCLIPSFQTAIIGATTPVTTPSGTLGNSSCGPSQCPSIKPAFSWTTGNGSVAFNDATAFTNSRLVSISWNFGDGTNGTGSSPLHAYAKTGNYTVKESVVASANINGSLLRGSVSHTIYVFVPAKGSTTTSPPGGAPPPSGSTNPISSSAAFSSVNLPIGLALALGGFSFAVVQFIPLLGRPGLAWLVGIVLGFAGYVAGHLAAFGTAF